MDQFKHAHPVIKGGSRVYLANMIRVALLIRVALTCLAILAGRSSFMRLRLRWRKLFLAFCLGMWLPDDLGDQYRHALIVLDDAPFKFEVSLVSRRAAS